LAVEDPGGKARFSDLLAVGEFRALWIAQIASVLGDQLARVALTLQVALGATVAPVHVLAVMAKSPGLVPVSVTEVMCRLALPLLVTVTLFAALVVPVF